LCYKSKGFAEFRDQGEEGRRESIEELEASPVPNGRTTFSERRTYEASDHLETETDLLFGMADLRFVVESKAEGCLVFHCEAGSTDVQYFKGLVRRDQYLEWPLWPDTLGSSALPAWNGDGCGPKDLGIRGRSPTIRGRQIGLTRGGDPPGTR